MLSGARAVSDDPWPRLYCGASARAGCDAPSQGGEFFTTYSAEAAALLGYFTDHDMDVDSVHYDVDRTDEDGWEAEWAAYIEDAGLTGKAPKVRVVRFLRARADSGAADKAYNGRAKGVVTLLKDKGITLSDGTVSELERVLIMSEAGDIQQQATCIEVIWLIYLGELPSESVAKWYRDQRRIMTDMGAMTPVELRNHPEYKACIKDSTTPVLERVLSSWTSTGYTSWMQYYHLTKQRLHGHGFPLACRRLEAVFAVPEEQFCAAENGKTLIRKYLWNIFFSEWMGLGLPMERGQKSWDKVMLPPKGTEALTLMEERPTMAKEAHSSPLNGVSGFHKQVLMQAQQLVAGLGLGAAGGRVSQEQAALQHQQQVMQQAWM